MSRPRTWLKKDLSCVAGGGERPFSVGFRFTGEKERGGAGLFEEKRRIASALSLMEMALLCVRRREGFAPLRHEGVQRVEQIPGRYPQPVAEADERGQPGQDMALFHHGKMSLADACPRGQYTLRHAETPACVGKDLAEKNRAGFTHFSTVADCRRLLNPKYFSGTRAVSGWPFRRFFRKAANPAGKGPHAATPGKPTAQRRAKREWRRFIRGMSILSAMRAVSAA